MTPDDDDLTPDPQTAADDAVADAHTERWREERARGREHDAIVEDWWAEVGLLDRLSVADLAARVRADERDRAAGRVERVEGGYSVPLGASPGMVVDRMRQEFLAAIREGGA